MKKTLLLSTFFIYTYTTCADQKNNKKGEEGKKQAINSQQNTAITPVRKFTFGSKTTAQLPSATKCAHAKMLIDIASPNSVVAILHHAAQKAQNLSDTATLTPEATIALSQASSTVAAAAATQVTKNLRRGSHEHKKQFHKSPTPPKQGDRRPAFLVVDHPALIAEGAKTPRSPMDLPAKTPRSTRTTPSSKSNKQHTPSESLEGVSFEHLNVTSSAPTHGYEWEAIAIYALQNKAGKEKDSRPRHDSSEYHASPSTTPCAPSRTSSRDSVYANYTGARSRPSSEPNTPTQSHTTSSADSMHMPTANNTTDGIHSARGSLSTSSDGSEE